MSSALTLYELSSQEASIDAELDRLLEESYGEVTDRAEEMMEALDLTEGAIRQKLDGYYRVLQNYNAYCEGLEKEAERLKERAEKARKKIDFLEGRVHQYMDERDIREIQTDHTKFRLVGTGGKAPVIIDDEDALPHPFLRYQLVVKWEGCDVSSEDQETIEEVVRLFNEMKSTSVRFTKSPNKNALHDEAESGTELPVRIGGRKKKLKY